MNYMAVLGPGAFETISGEFVNVLLAIASATIPVGEHSFVAIDASDSPAPEDKASTLRHAEHVVLKQKELLNTPDARLTFGSNHGAELLLQHAVGLAGIQNGDSPKFQRKFWEVLRVGDLWHFQQGTVERTCPYGGRELVILYDRAAGHLREDATVRRERLHDSDQRGNQAWGRTGVVVSQMGDLPVTLYTGDLYDQSCAVVLPKNSKSTAAIWAFCSSPEFLEAVREIDQSIKVTPNTLVKVPFDLAQWQAVATEAYPDGLPKPHSDDPTQWLFSGHPRDSEQPLQVAVARLLGYRWPRQTGSAFTDCPAIQSDASRGEIAMTTELPA